jgi:hypothetical protein
MFKTVIRTVIDMSQSPAESDLHRISTDKGIEFDQNKQRLKYESSIHNVWISLSNEFNSLSESAKQDLP